MKKQERHQTIRNLVETRNIETQEDLANALKEKGIRVTQATVSRDIKELMLVKVSDMRGSYRYSIPKERNHMMSTEQLERLVGSQGRMFLGSHGHLGEPTAGKISYLWLHRKKSQSNGIISQSQMVSLRGSRVNLNAKRESAIFFGHSS